MNRKRLAALALAAIGILTAGWLLAYPMPEVMDPEAFDVLAPPEVDLGADVTPIALGGAAVALLTWVIRRFSSQRLLESPRYLFAVSTGLSIVLGAGQMALGGMPFVAALKAAALAWAASQGMRKLKKLGPLDLAKRP